MQGNTIPNDIATCFKDNYAEIFQSELANERNFIAFLGDLKVACKVADWKPFSLEETIIAVHQLHPNKNDTDFLLTSNAFINASLSFLRTLVLLINQCALHGFILLQGIYIL